MWHIEMIGQLVTLALVHASWIGLAVAAVVALLLPVRHRWAPESRYRGVLLAFVLVIFGPLVATVLQSLPHAPQPQQRPPSVVVTSHARSLPVFSTSTAGPTASPAPRSTATMNIIEITCARSLAVLAAGSRSFQRIQPALFTVWLVGACLLLARLALAGIGLGRLRASARPAPAEMVLLVASLRHRMGLLVSPHVLVHDRLEEPMVGGVRRPVILLPGAWAHSLTMAQLEAILAHELAHLRRHDLLVNLVQRLAEALLLFHPAVRWLSNQVRVERECCADRLAVTVTGDPFPLAQVLESLARARWKFAQKLTLAAPLGGGESSLLPRIQELLGMTPTPARFHGWPLAALPCAAGLAVLAGSLGFAQEPNPPAQAQALGPENTRSATVPVRENFHFEFAPGPGQAVTVVGSQGGFERPQISYEVRYLEIDSRLKMQDDSLTPSPDDPNVGTSILDAVATERIYTKALSSLRAKGHQAPKVTAYEADTAKITMQDTQYFVKALEPIVGPDGIAFKPTVEKLHPGSQVGMSTRLAGNMMQLEVQISDLDLVSFETKTQDASDGKKSLRAQFHIPHTIERKYEGSVKLADGQTLLVSLGQYPRTWPREGAFWSAIRRLQLEVGGPAIGMEPGSIEKLVLITPRRILLEHEEAALGRQAVADPSVLPTSGQDPR